MKASFRTKARDLHLEAIRRPKGVQMTEHQAMEETIPFIIMELFRQDLQHRLPRPRTRRPQLAMKRYFDDFSFQIDKDL